MKCAVYCCKNNRRRTRGKSFFRFPKDAELCKKWIEKIGRFDYKPSESSNVCEDHFNSNSLFVTKRGKTVNDGETPVHDFKSCRDCSNYISPSTDGLFSDCSNSSTESTGQENNILPESKPQLPHQSNHNSKDFKNVVLFGSTAANQVQQHVKCEKEIIIDSTVDFATTVENEPNRMIYYEMVMPESCNILVDKEENSGNIVLPVENDCFITNVIPNSDTTRHSNICIGSDTPTINMTEAKTAKYTIKDCLESSGDEESSHMTEREERLYSKIKVLRAAVVKKNKVIKRLQENLRNAVRKIMQLKSGTKNNLKA